MPSNNLSVDSNIQAKDLEARLKEANLSEEQIKEVVPAILTILEKLKDVETKNTESGTNEELGKLSQSIINTNNFSIEQNGTGDITIKTNNTVNNNISHTVNITINTPQPHPQQAPQGVPQQIPQQAPQQAPQGVPQQAPQQAPEIKNGNINTYALRDGNFIRIFENNQDNAKNFLENLNNNSLSDQQITFCQSNMPQLYPYFEKYGMTDQVHQCIQTRGGKYNESINKYGNIDWKTAYKTGGITGLLTNTLINTFPNVKPEQASNMSNIAVAAAGIFAVYKIGKWFFGKNKKGERNLGGKIAGLAGIYFAPQLLLGKDGFSILGDILSGKADFGELGYRAGNSLRFLKNNDSEVYNQMAPGVLGMSLFPQTYTVGNVRALQQTFSDQNARKQRYTSTYDRLNKDNSALANEFKNTFNADHYDEKEWNLFLAKLGINENSKNDTIFFNEANKTTDKKTSFELRMKSQGKEKNPTFKKEIDNYLKQNGEFNPENLNPQRFIEKSDATFTERPEDIQNKEKLVNQVDNLSIDQQTKTELKNEIQAFYNERPIETKPNLNDFSLELDNNLLVIKSHHGEKTKINLQYKTLTGFGNNGANTYEIPFTRIKDLLNVADLTNHVLDIFKNRQIADTPPFQYKFGKLGKGIYFNNADNRSLDYDVKALSSGLLGGGGAIGKIDTLKDHPEEYAQYLSNRRIENLTPQVQQKTNPPQAQQKTQ